MGKIAFVFSGQGAQYSGMGKELYETVPAAAAVFDAAEKIRPGTIEQCFGGSEEALAQTANTQPCMLAMELAAAAALTDAGIRPAMTAGFSLGEIAALTYSKAVTFEEGFRLVCLRGTLMQEAAQKVESGMAAILKLEATQVERLCKEYQHVYPVNYNCPGQITVAGLKEELSEFTKSVKAAGGASVPLRVKGGFHSPFMAEAAEKFKEALVSAAIMEPEIPLYSDCTGLPYEGNYVQLLSQQICSPVRWQNIVEHMIGCGADTFIELGPGKTLCGLIVKTNPNMRVFHVEDCASLNEAIEGVKAC